MPVVKYKKGDRLTMRVVHADNLLLGYLVESTTIRRKVYERMTDYDPQFQDEVDITPGLRGAKQDMLLTGINFTGGGQIEFMIEVNGADKFRVAESLNQNSSKSWHVIFEKT